MRQVIFTGLMVMTPAVFAAMLLATSNVIAACAVTVAYASVVLGEKLD